jgi:hypothetical protein
MVLPAAFGVLERCKFGYSHGLKILWQPMIVQANSAIIRQCESYVMAMNYLRNKKKVIKLDLRQVIYIPPQYPAQDRLLTVSF